MENHYKVSGQALDILIQLGYVGGGFDKLEPDEKIQIKLEAALESDPFFSRIDTFYESHRFQLAMTRSRGSEDDVMPMNFSFRWDHLKQKVTLDALEVLREGRVLHWEAGQGKPVPHAQELRRSMESRTGLSAAFRHHITEQAADVLAPLVRAGYIHDPVQCRDNLVDEICKAADRQPGHQGYSVELFVPLPRSQYSVRMQFGASIHNCETKLLGLDIYSPGHTLMMVDRDILPLPAARDVMQVLNAVAEEQERLAEEKLGKKVFLHRAKQRKQQLMPDTTKLQPLAVQLRKAGYFEGQPRDAETRYIMAAAKKLSEGFSYKYVADNQYRFSSPLSLKGAAGKQAEITVQHALDMNSMQLSLAGVLITHRRDKNVAILAEPAQPLAEVLRELETRRQIRQITDTLAEAEFIASEYVTVAALHDVLHHNRVEYDGVQKAPLLCKLDLNTYTGSKEVDFQAQIQITPVSQSCRLIGVAGKLDDVTIRLFPDRHNRLSHAMIATERLVEKHSRAESIRKAQDILNGKSEKPDQSVNLSNGRKTRR